VRDAMAGHGSVGDVGLAFSLAVLIKGRWPPPHASAALRSVARSIGMDRWRDLRRITR